MGKKTDRVRHKTSHNKIRITSLLLAGLCGILLLAGCLGQKEAVQTSGKEQAAAPQAAGQMQTTSSDKPGDEDLSALTIEVAKHLQEQTPDPQVSSIGGEWVVIGLKHSGLDVPETYYDHYFDNVRVEVKRKQGILSENHYTEYARVILACCTIGKDFTDIEGYDLRPFLDDYEKIEAQGSNAAAFALIAANTGGFSLDNEEPYVQLILKEADLAKMGDEVLTDYLAMGAEALSFYKDRPEVQRFLDDVVKTLSEEQVPTGAMNNAESTAECVIALTQLGIDPIKDERFIKNGHTLFDGLMEYYLGDGAFYHDDTLVSPDAMATERVLLALDALLLWEQGRTFYEK